MGDLRFSVWRILHGYRDPVAGTFRLTAKDWQRTKLTYVGVVSAPGLPPTPVSHRTTEPSKRWVMDGMDLPVIVDRAAPTKLKIIWKQVPTERQYAANLQQQEMQMAAETAARMAAGDATAGTNPIGTLFPGNVGSFAGGGDLAQAVTDAITAAFGGHQGTTWSDSHVHVQIMDGAPLVNGQPATAVVQAAQDVTLPGFVGGMVPGGVVDLTLEVTPPNGAALYTAHTRMAFSTPQRRALVTTPGTRLPVRIDPAAPTRVVIDKAALNLD